MFKRFRQGTISILGVLASLSLAPIANAAEPLVTAVANAASYHAGSVSPGQMVVIFGVRLGPSSITSFQLDSRGRIATSLAGTQVTFDGIPAPLLYVSQAQVAAVVPYAVSGRAITQIRVLTPEGTSQPFLRSIAKASPGIFTVDSSGRGQGAISNSTGTPNSPSAPALPGSFVSIFLTGEGLTDPLDVDGAIAAEAASTREAVSVRIAGRSARVLYAGAAPGNVRGFAQLNVVIPTDLEFGGSLPLEVQFGDAVSQNDVTIAIAGELPAKPGIPQQVTAAAEASQIMIRWTAADARATRFRIERRVAALGDFAEIGTVGATARGYADSSITAGVAYIYRVRSENAQGISEPSSPSLATASASLLAAPTDFRATAMSPTQINLSWSASGAPATSFVIERRQESVAAFAFFATASPGSVRAFQDSTAQPDTKYRYRIRALDSAGGSPFSEEATATTPALVLTAPVLRATAISTSRIRLTWTATATGIVRFIVERRSGNGQYVEVSRPGSAVTTLDDDGLAASTQYVYRMRLETTAALSPYSNEATATTLQGLPLAPTNLQATATSSTEVTLTWVNNAPDATAVRIGMAENGATAYTDIGNVPSLTSARITNLRPSTAYSFVVRAQSVIGLSPSSSPASVTTMRGLPLAPTNLGATATSSSQIGLSWSNNAPDAFAIRVEARTGPTGTFSDIGPAATLSSTPITNTQPNTVYTFRVRAQNAAGYSPYSNEASRTTPPVQTTIFLIHGLGQDPSYMRSLHRSLEGTSGVDTTRFKVDSGFDFSECADPPWNSSCPANCTITAGAQRLAQYIANNNPPGDIVLIGFSMGGLIARDMMTYRRSSRKVAALVTLGTPNLGYPYHRPDTWIFCTSLVQAMDGNWRSQQLSNPPYRLSPYLDLLTNQWPSTQYPGNSGRWLAASGRSCKNPTRTFNSTTGCRDSNPSSDGVVCDDSAAYNTNTAPGSAPSQYWRDPGEIYVHSNDKGGWGTSLILCGNSGDKVTNPPLSDPAPNGSLLRAIKELINGL
jgi:uncharacterized protein (TIGR03437 family)